MKKIEDIFLRSSQLFIPGGILLTLGKARLLMRASNIELNINSLALVASWDALTFAFICVFICMLPINKSFRFLISYFAYIVLWFGIVFHIKMGLPLTFGLLQQTGNFFDLQTSIASSGTGRTAAFFVLSLIAYLVIYFICTKLSFLLFKLKYIFLALILSLAALAQSIPLGLRDYSNNIFLSLLRSSTQKNHAVVTRAFEKIKSSPIKLVTNTVTKKQKKNVIFLLLESFSYEVIDSEEKFQSTMPYLHSIKSQFSSFNQHLTPWPFSSKSLYAVICNTYPQIDSFIETRIHPEVPCPSWTKSLHQHGYNTWSGYSGDFRYDQMGEFLKHNGFDQLVDKNTFLQHKNYKQMSWGIDDQALIDAFSIYLESVKPPFLSLLIPINSHHPGWTPNNKYEKFDHPMKNAFHYQDHLIKTMISLIKKHGFWKNSVVIITGDHGRRMEPATLSSGTLDKVDYHIPLFIYGMSDSPTTSNRPSNHVELGGRILQEVGVAGEYLLDHDLRGKIPSFVFYSTPEFRFLVLDKEANMFDLNSGLTYKGKNWVNHLDDECSAIECQDSLRWMSSVVQTSNQLSKYFE